jgi:hypothetical protein
LHDHLVPAVAGSYVDIQNLDRCGEFLDGNVCALIYHRQSVSIVFPLLLPKDNGTYRCFSLVCAVLENDIAPPSDEA